MVPAIGEANARDIGIGIFVHVINRASPHSCQGYPTATLAGWKDHIWVGDGVARGVANLELHRDCLAGFARVYARAVRIDRRQNDASGVRAAAAAVVDRQCAIHVADRVVAQASAHRCARRDGVRGARHCRRSQRARAA